MHTTTLDATLILDAKAQLGEGSIWHPIEQKLYWLDIEGRELHIFDPVTKEDKFFNVGERVGTIVPAEDGGLLLALENGIHFFDTKNQKLTFLSNPLEKGIRFNDGKCDPEGRFWVGSMHLKFVKGAASLYRFNADKSLHEIVTGITCSNGIAWTADKKTMYYIDTPTGNIDAFDYDNASGNINNRRLAIKVPDGNGLPDGMTIDSEDKLWVALWGGYGVARFDATTGKMIEKVYVPAPHTTSCAFGGDDLKTLFITTAWHELSLVERQKFPFSGGLFYVDTNVKGVDTNFYKGNV
jgi:sugar lactone lactonase YvrE